VDQAQRPVDDRAEDLPSPNRSVLLAASVVEEGRRRRPTSTVDARIDARTGLAARREGGVLACRGKHTAD
jgi:hypothetical protein